MNLEINRHADPANLSDIALLGRDKAPAFNGVQRSVIELLAPAAFLNLNLARFSAGQHLNP